MNMEMASKGSFCRLLILLSLTLTSCTQGPGGPMGNWGPMMGFGGGGGFMWIIVVVFVGVAIYYMLQISKSKNSDGSAIEAPLEILKKRYAKGEIDKEEFERKKKDLEN
jgi:putative membrane protein